MAYNFLELVNGANRKLNEVELTAAQFPSAKGFYAQLKDAVNASLRDINQSHFEWPFNHIEAEETLTAGTSRYAYPSDASIIDFDSFRIKANSTFGNETKRLSVITYDSYLQNFVDQEYTADTNKRDVPSYVCQAPSQEYVISPSPKEAYEIVYEYYRIPVDLVSATDVPFIPERYKQVIMDGTMYHAYLFRSNEQAATLAKSKFEEGVKRMRTMLVNRYSYMRSGMIVPSKATAFGDRVS